MDRNFIASELLTAAKEMTAASFDFGVTTSGPESYKLVATSRTRGEFDFSDLVRAASKLKSDVKKTGDKITSKIEVAINTYGNIALTIEVSSDLIRRDISMMNFSEKYNYNEDW